MGIGSVTFAAALLAAGGGPGRGEDPVFVYVGTYTGRDGARGIELLRLDPASGDLTPAGTAAEASNPSFLAIHPNRRFLYAVNEVADFEGRKTGVVSAFAIEPATGALRFLNRQSSEGTGPCYVSVDPSGRCVLVANYGGGSVAALPIREDGGLGPAGSSVKHQGSGPNPRRQKEPHAHCIVTDPAGRFAFAADLGLDKVLVYRLDAAAAGLVPNEPPAASVEPGSGPRHFAFHPGGKWAYVINELSSTVTAFRYDAGRGALEPFQTVSTLPADFKGTNYTAEVVVSPDGRTLYGSNRGHDSLAIFRIDPADGRLTPAGHVSTGGKWPRNFALAPGGRWLLAANQNSDSIVVFRVDSETGGLVPAGRSAKVAKPVCIRFLAAAP
ncbi:MAG TPA: lactonase family protein [Planctomycetota bacterium]|nr:lactonase family protein [Planctomycetota bacterium]